METTTDVIEFQKSLGTDHPLQLLTFSEETIRKNRITFEECYRETICVLKRYVDMQEDYYKFIALWTLGTYLHESFNTYPYLFFNAMKGSGKTRTLKLISSIGNQGDGSVENNLTEAVLFRVPRGKITCIDEVEQINSKEKQTLRELLNSAYKKGMKVKRMKKVKKEGGEKYVVEEFEPYFPICMANIRGVEEVLADRSIVMILEKSNNSLLTKKIEDFDRYFPILAIKANLKEIRCSLCSVVMQKNYQKEWNNYIDYKYNYTTTLTTLDTPNTLTTPEIKDEEMLFFFNKIDEAGISGRNFELMYPMFIIAKLINDETFDEILRIAKNIVTEKKDEEYAEDKDVALIEFISNQGFDRFGQYVLIKNLVSEFRAKMGDTEERDEAWLNDRWMGRALKRLALYTNKRRVSSGVEVILDIHKAKERIKMFKDVKPEVKQ